MGGEHTSEHATTYISSVLLLDSGRVALTPPNDTPIPVPDKPFWLRGLSVEVTEEDPAVSVPLTEVYLHHVAFYDGSLGADVCGGANLDSRDALWSIGAESRHTRTFFPNGFGYPVGNLTTNTVPGWAANIHIIRTVGVPHVKRCIECSCPGGGGSEDCCPDGSLCPGMNQSSHAVSSAREVKAYRLKYTLFYDSMVQGNEVEPVRYHTLDAGACQLEWNVPAVCPWKFHHAGTAAGTFQLPGRSGLRGTGRYFPFDILMEPADKLPPHCIADQRWSMEWPYDGRIVFGKGHIHIGAIDLALYRNENELLCRTVARYGTGHNSSSEAAQHPEIQPAGNELGYVVEVTNCDEAFQTPVKVRKGEVLTVVARYRAQPWFDGVMGLFDIVVAPDRRQTIA
ncbi:hypothetical protein CYMTET_15883 [Cymbomonas tetramitiformis]|uniref:Uncharacterized protein n=1 Tax=Cymbomonas tetramitiformis TaxID=36881 RepID=A0AAE0L8W4_9CHLO|nr:hypothetical protein CYMTET_15883 [Cymbomonas tetramitiformis]|eukprot:gene18521-22109_t